MFRRSRLLTSLAAGIAVTVASCSAVSHIHSTASHGVHHLADEVVAHPVPKLPCKPCMKSFAHDLDALEQSIDWYGSVVPKIPDVWGEARLTRHRYDFEKELEQDLGDFETIVNAKESRADSAFIAQAFALSAAIKGTAVNIGPAQALTRSAPNAQPPSQGNDPVDLEPTLKLEQKARYLNFLNQLRRTNEGDDTSDSPGYSLNLVRVPVSLLPGKRTQEGHGAEITFTIDPILSDELLPTTMRTLVTADLLESFGTQIVQILSDRTARKSILSHSNLADAIAGESDSGSRKGGRPSQTKSPVVDSYMSNKLRGAAHAYQRNSTRSVRGSYLSGRGMVDLLGEDRAFKVLKGVLRSVPVRGEDGHEYIHHPDVQGYLKDRLQEAYRFLTTDSRYHLWASYSTRELAQALRSKDQDYICCRQVDFFKETPNTADSLDVVSLSWCILCDAALLTERMLEDIKETSAAREKSISAPVWSDIAYPNPSSDARRLFNDYVKIRWPIHVFALDPMTQDQNVADAANLRRERQFALSAAFVSGRVNTSRFLQEARNLELQAETIALNRTQVGFSHGENTFGWRFYPRYQVPGFEYGLHDKLQKELFGSLSEGAKLRQRRIEPGPRECVAIVMMPCFVPYLRYDSFSNWFALDNPKHKVFDHTQAVELGKFVKSLETHGPQVADASCYRDGDFDRLIRRVRQLDARMPTQTATLPVPVRENLSGNDLFANGTTALAPELYGFYGAPGIDLNKEYVTLFLVGDRFSVNQTWVSIGNTRGERSDPAKRELPNFRLLSRQVIQIRIATKGVISDHEGYAHIHVATPYGVTQTVRIPVLNTSKAGATAPEGYKLEPTKFVVRYDAKRISAELLQVLPDTATVASNPNKLVIKANDALGVTPTALVMTWTVPNGSGTTPVIIQSPPLVLTAARDGFELPANSLNAELRKLAAQLVGANPIVKEGKNPLDMARKISVSITPSGPKDVFRGKEIDLGAVLEIEFRAVIDLPPPQPALPQPQPIPSQPPNPNP